MQQHPKLVEAWRKRILARREIDKLKEGTPNGVLLQIELQNLQEKRLMLDHARYETESQDRIDFQNGELLTSSAVLRARCHSHIEYHKVNSEYLVLAAKIEAIRKSEDEFKILLWKAGEDWVAAIEEVHGPVSIRITKDGEHHLGNGEVYKPSDVPE